MPGPRGKQLRLLHPVGWGCALLAVLIAAVILSTNRQQRKTLADQAREQGRHKMGVTTDHIEEYMNSIWLCTQLISIDPDIAKMSPGPYDQLRAVYKATYGHHRLTEIYVIERDFDGTQRPFLTLIKQDQGELIESNRSLAREAEEYTVLREHIRHFVEDPAAEFLVSKPVRLCVGRAGVACSVPVRSEGRFTGIVAGMVPSRDISRILQISSTGNEVILAKEDGSIFPCRDVSEETQAWFQEQFDQQGVEGFFENRERTFRVDGRETLWTPVEVPDNEKWYLAYICDGTDYPRPGSLQGVLIGWGSAGIVLLLGGAVMFLCRVIPALVAARGEADAHARELVESQARVQAIVDTAADGIITIDERGIVESFNAAAEHILGYAADEVIGRNVKTLMPPPHRERHDEYISRYLRTGEARIIGVGREVEGRRKDGTIFPLEVAVSEVRLVGKRSFTGIIRDISERKRSEEQARDWQAELAHVTRLGTMGEMASGLAHELNQPLSAIINYIQACLERIRAGVVACDELIEDMEDAAAQAERTGQIIDRIRNFVRKRKPTWMMVDINALVREVIGLVEPEIRLEGTEMRLELEEALPALKADPVQIQQVVMNLMRNGLDAMQESGPGTQQLTVRTSRVGKELVECAIQDAGPGLCEPAVDRAFDPFFTTKADGMGMGLSISRTIVERHGGRLWATPNPDRGVTFRFTLPIERRRSSE